MALIYRITVFKSIFRLQYAYLAVLLYLLSYVHSSSYDMLVKIANKAKIILGTRQGRASKIVYGFDTPYVVSSFEKPSVSVVAICVMISGLGYPVIQIISCNRNTPVIIEIFCSHKCDEDQLKNSFINSIA